MAYLNRISVDSVIYDLRQVYPVGAIWMSTDATSPASLFGGTWEKIEDRFLLAAGTAYTAGAAGGEAVHTLTADEIPAHTHLVTNKYGNVASGNLMAALSTYNNRNAPYEEDRSTQSAGGGLAHNNMPPYLAVHIWKRTA